MSTGKELNYAENLATISLGYDMTLVLPIEDAMEIMRRLKKAERIRSKWNSANQSSTNHLGGDMTNFQIQLMAASTYAETKMNGAYPEDK